MYLYKVKIFSATKDFQKRSLLATFLVAVREGEEEKVEEFALKKCKKLTDERRRVAPATVYEIEPAGILDAVLS